jgi:hypothetical protein
MLRRFTVRRERPDHGLNSMICAARRLMFARRASIIVAIEGIDISSERQTRHITS